MMPQVLNQSIKAARTCSQARRPPLGGGEGVVGGHLVAGECELDGSAWGWGRWSVEGVLRGFSRRMVCGELVDEEEMVC